MTDQEIIELLKTNEKAFCYLSEEVKEFAEKNHEKFLYGAPNFFRERPDTSFYDDIVYRLHPDFKPPKPEPKFEWVEYAVATIKNIDWVVDPREPICTLSEVSDFADTLGRFGGVQFDGQDHGDWCMTREMFINSEGYIHQYSDSDSLFPAVPCKVRFWKEVEVEEGGAEC